MPGEYSIRTPHVGRVSTATQCMKKEYNAIIEEIVTDRRTLLEHCRLVSLVWNRKNLLVPGPAFVHSHTHRHVHAHRQTHSNYIVYTLNLFDLLHQQKPMVRRRQQRWWPNRRIGCGGRTVRETIEMEIDKMGIRKNKSADK